MEFPTLISWTSQFLSLGLDIISNLASSEISLFYRVFVAEQAGLGMILIHVH